MTEVPKLRDQAKPDATCFYVCVRVASNLGDGIPKRPKKEVEAYTLVPRLNLCPEKVFKRRSAAAKEMKKVCNRLRHAGYVVNPWEPAYSLYVIELKKPKGHKGDLPPLYVGQTSIAVEDRYAQHLAGGKLASKKVTGKAVKLRPDLVPAGKQYNQKASVAAETRLGRKLQKDGYVVVGPQNLPTGNDTSGMN